MCAVHTLPYLSHKMVKIMFLMNIYSISVVQIISTMFGFKLRCTVLVNLSPSIYHLTITCTDNIHKI